MTSRSLACPRCPGEILDVVAHDRHEIDLCSSCRGVWLDAGEWSTVIGPAASPAKLSSVRSVAAGSPECIACVTPAGLAPPTLQARMILGADDVVIDACPRCNGAWLDGGELPKLRQSLSATRARVTTGPVPPPVPEPPAGPSAKDAGRYKTMGDAMATTGVAMLGTLLQMAAAPRRRGLFGRRRRGSPIGSLASILLRLFR